MNKKVAVIWVSLAMILSFIVIIIEIAQVVEAPTIWYVDDVPGSGGPGDPPEDFTSIQDAINMSQPGDSVFVYNGIYYENVVVNKTINLTGENRDTTIIDGSGVGKVVRVEANDVVIVNLTITNAGSNEPWGPYGYEYDAGIEILSDGSIIEGCNFTNIPRVPLFFYGYASQNFVVNNTFSGSYMNAIRFTGQDFNHNIFLSNEFLGTSYGMVAYSVMNFDDVLIQGNTFIGTKWNGITLSLTQPYQSADRVIIKNNKIGGFEVGLLLRHTYDSKVFSNTFYDNTDTGIYLVDSTNNLIYHNNLINNAIQAYDNKNNKWDNGYPSGGNYWFDFDEPSEGAYDDYQGPGQNVLNSDGIVDNGIIVGGGKNPYVIDADSQDNYPLINPVENYIFLYEGWNLISTPFIQTEQNLTKVLKTIDGYYDAVQWYDITDKNDHWKHYKISKPYGNDLIRINESIGFWIHITKPGGTIFKYNGIKPTQNQTVVFHPGWNLVGYPSLTSYNRTTGLNNIFFPYEVNSIWTYDAVTQKWKELGPSDYFEIGRGYWVHANIKCEWEVPL